MAGAMVNGKVEALLAEFPSPPPDTVALSCPVPGALLAILNVMIIEGKPLFTVRASDRVQVRLLSVQFHPVPLIAVAVNAAERVFVTVIVPLDGILPRLPIITP